MTISGAKGVASLAVVESIIFDNNETLEQWKKFAQIAYDLPTIEGIHDTGLIKGIEALKAGYELVDGYVDITIGNPTEEETYVFVKTKTCTTEISQFMHWLLMSLPQINVLKVDADKNIEFSAESDRAVQNLELLIDWLGGNLFYGSLEEYYNEES